jgi:hypothetical protein
MPNLWHVLEPPASTCSPWMILSRLKAQDRIKYGMDDQALRSIDEHILGKHARRPALDGPIEQAAGDQLALSRKIGTEPTSPRSFRACEPLLVGGLMYPCMPLRIRFVGSYAGPLGSGNIAEMNGSCQTG